MNSSAGTECRSADFVLDGVGCIHYGQIYTYYGTWATETLSFVPPEKAASLAKVDHGDVIITNTSENLDDVCKAVAWLGATQIVTGGHATVLKHGEDAKYIAYYLQTDEFNAQKRRLATGTKVIDVSAKSLAKIRIPVPPMEVQREIVRVLDLFQSLEAELEAELEARRRQYAHYREAVLPSDVSSTGLTRLGDVADIKVGFPFKSSRFSDDLDAASLVRGDNIGQGLLKDRSFKRWHRSANDGLTPYELAAGDVVVAMDRPLDSGWTEVGPSL